MVMEGFATMYMRMPMSSSTLPIQGKCAVDDKTVTLKFPSTEIKFDLPSTPKEGRNDFDFPIGSAKGKMLVTIGYIEDLKCFTGVSKLEEEDEPCLSFCFFRDESPMSKLPKH